MILGIDELWENGTMEQWLYALSKYWMVGSVRANIELEKEINNVNSIINSIRDMDDKEFLTFCITSIFSGSFLNVIWQIKKNVLKRSMKVINLNCMRLNIIFFVYMKKSF